MEKSPTLDERSLAIREKLNTLHERLVTGKIDIKSDEYKTINREINKGLRELRSEIKALAKSKNVKSGLNLSSILMKNLLSD